MFSAGALTNLGDGLVALALPWLATLLTRDPVAIAAVAAAGRIPWLLFSLPAGVIADRTDRRKLIARSDVLRALIVGAILLLAMSGPSPSAIWILAGLALLLGSAEVLRDNASQTILPDIVASDDLEKANGQLWSIEQLTGQFIGPPLAGFLIAVGIAVPFGLHFAALILAAGLVWMITLAPKDPVQESFVQALKDGVAFMRSDPVLLRLAIVLGCANFLAMLTITVQVIFAQDVLALDAVTYGIILSIAAAGAIAGSLSAPVMIRLFGTQSCLYFALAAWGVGYGVVGVSQSGVTMAIALFSNMFAAMVWNVITVSWRQRRIPAELLGRVNSIYRFFGWGSMPLGSLAGGAIVAVLEPDLGRELALRAPFYFAALASVALLLYGLFRLRLE